MPSRSNGPTALAIAALLSGCIDYLQPGSVGETRYFGEVRSVDPLPPPLLPPISDRDGNGYVLSGSRDLRQVTVYTGQAGGGFSSGCALHKGDTRGAHGWVGRSQDHAWYWSGNGLVDVTGATGGCTYVLDHDPATAASIAFLGVVPSVRDAPSRTTVVALIQTPTDPQPYWVVVDLRNKRYTQLRKFTPSDASNVVVLGTGASDDIGAGVMLVKYQRGGGSVVESRYLDADANELASASVAGLDAAGEDEVLGFLAVSQTGLASGVLANGQYVAFGPSGGAAHAVNGLTAAGVHAVDGSLWLVGTNATGPVIAPIDNNGSILGASAWSASGSAGTTLRGSLQVIDDRAAPLFGQRRLD